MNITIRRADLDQDRDLLIDTIGRNLTASSDQRRFDWLYRQNPHGPAQVWLAVDSETRKVVGVSGAFARRMVVDGIEKSGWVLGDFCIAETYRSLGPALQLQKATLEQIQESKESDFCYDFPSRGLMAIYRRLGIKATGQMVRLAKPLRLERKLEQLSGSKALARSAGWLGNALLAGFQAPFARKSRWDFAIHEGECGDEFTSLRAGNPVPMGLEIKRSAEYLNWRYLHHPLLKYSILTARRGSTLEGYMVFSCTGEDAHIAEWCVGDEPGVLEALITDVARRLRKQRIMALSAFMMDADPRLPQLMAAGFRRRESTDVVVLSKEPSSVSEQPWLLMQGDRDI